MKTIQQILQLAFNEGDIYKSEIEDEARLNILLEDGLLKETSTFNEDSTYMQIDTRYQLTRQGLYIAESFNKCS